MYRPGSTVCVPIFTPRILVLSVRAASAALACSLDGMADVCEELKFVLLSVSEMSMV